MENTNPGSKYDYQWRVVVHTSIVQIDIMIEKYIASRRDLNEVMGVFNSTVEERVVVIEGINVGSRNRMNPPMINT